MEIPMLLNLLRTIARMDSRNPNCVVNGIPMRLDFREFIQRSMADGVYEPVRTGWVKRHLQAGSVFIDIGASFGYYTSLAWSLVGASGRVFSFEPSPHAYSTLKNNLHGSEFSNITFI